MYLYGPIYLSKRNQPPKISTTGDKTARNWKELRASIVNADVTEEQTGLEAEEESAEMLSELSLCKDPKRGSREKPRRNGIEWKRMNKIRWPYKVRNEGLLRRVGEVKTILDNIIKSRKDRF